MTPALMEMVQREEKKARAYKSKHEYSAEQFGLTREAIVARFLSLSASDLIKGSYLFMHPMASVPGRITAQYCTSSERSAVLRVD